MSTIQDALRNCNKDEIASMFLYKYGFMSSICCRDDFDNVTIGEYKDIIKKRVCDTIEKLCNMTPKPSEEREVLMVVHSSREYRGDDDIEVNLYKAADLMEDKEFYTSYGYAFSPFEETLSFEIADTYLTHYYLDDLIVDYLFEVTFTGWDQESLEEEVASILESSKEAEEHKDDPDYFKSGEEFFNQLREDIGYEFEKEDPEQHEAWCEYIKKQGEYCTKCAKIEIRKWREAELKKAEPKQ